MTDHSPTPWTYFRKGEQPDGPIVGLADADGEIVAAPLHECLNICREDAEFLCRAVNSHYDLLAACRAYLHLIGMSDHMQALLQLDSVIGVMRAAVAKAEVATQREETSPPDPATAWVLTDDELPPVDAEVEAMDSAGYRQNFRYGSNNTRLWWKPDRSMYVYFTPIKWRHIR